MSERKYRQQGYQDSGPKREPGRRPAGASKPPETYGPKALNLPPMRTISRCAACGAVLSSAAPGADACPGCGASLHACTQCAHFDPGSRFQCSRPVAAAVQDKTARNECDLFELRTTVERDVSTSATNTASARSGFDALFKK